MMAPHRGRSLRTAARASLREFASHNMVLKASALGLAILMFSLVHGAEDMHRTVYVDVVVQPPSGSEDMILVSDIPDRVRLRIKGSRSRLNALRPENLPAVEVRPRTVDDEHFYFEDQQFDMPAGVDVTEVVPPAIDVRWAARSTKWIEVKLETVGELDPELEWHTEPKLKPNVVLAEGPAEVLGGMGRARTTALDLSTVTEGPAERDIRIVSAPSNTSFNVQEVSVSWHARVKLSERVLYGVAVVTPEGVRAVRPRVVTIRVRGPKKQVDDLTSGSLRAGFDPSAAPARGSAELPVVISGLPRGTEVLTVEPSQVSVSGAAPPG